MSQATESCQKLGAMVLVNHAFQIFHQKREFDDNGETDYFAFYPVKHGPKTLHD